MTPAEIRELIADLDYAARTPGMTTSGLAIRIGQAATVLDELLARCEGMERLLREARLHVRTVDGVIEAKIDAALSGGE